MSQKTIARKRARAIAKQAIAIELARLERLAFDRPVRPAKYGTYVAPAPIQWARACAAYVADRAASEPGSLARAHVLAVLRSEPLATMRPVSDACHSMKRDARTDGRARTIATPGAGPGKTIRAPHAKRTSKRANETIPDPWRYETR